MKNTKQNSSDEIRFVGEAERAKMQEYINKYNKKMKKKDRIIGNIIHAVKYVFYTPLSIATNVVAVVFKIGGSLTAIGMPYGLYCAYKMIVQMRTGMKISEIEQTTFVCLFVIFPFTAFALSLAFQKLSEYFMYNK